MTAGYHVDADRELISLGVSNLVTGLFQGFSVSGSASRTPVAEQSGAKTQLAGVAGALCIIILLQFAPTLLRNLPRAALGAVVVTACQGQMEISGAAR